MSNAETKSAKKQDVNWLAVLWYIHLHVLGFYGIWLLISASKWMTVLFTLLVTTVACLGVTVGAHRFWAHRTFTAPAHVRLFLMLAHTLAGVGSIYDWVLAHRIHHKYYGTDKDPYNHKKGFWYCHYFSNFVMRGEEYEKIKNDIDMRDIEADGYVWIQKKFYWVLFPIVGILFPLNAPLEYWDESLAICVCVVGFTRLVITLNTAWLVNSSMLVWGMKEGEKLMSIFDTISLLYRLFFKMPKSHGTVVIDSEGIHSKIPSEGNSVFFITKSFWPSYHYTIPWDWKSGEFGTYGTGFSTFILKMWSELGLISELQTTKTEEIREALYKIATKRSSWNDGMEELKTLSGLNAKKEKLIPFQ